MRNSSCCGGRWVVQVLRVTSVSGDPARTPSSVADRVYERQSYAVSMAV